MGIVLSHSTAFLVWRAFTGKIDALPSASLSAGSAGRVRLTPKLREQLAAFGVEPPPCRVLHCLVSDDNQRPKIPGVVAHIAKSPLPPASFFRLTPQIDIVSPELCFLQLARVLSPEKLAMAGMELCGTYSLREDKCYSRRPLTSVAKLTNFLNAVPGVAGMRQANRILPHLLDNAASPMEAKLALLLCLPTMWGGYGLPAPELNPTIKLHKNARALYRVRSCRPDLHWRDAGVAVEYDGQDHENEDTHAKDVARIAALRTEGLDVMVLTYSQLANPEAFDVVAHTLAKQLGHRLRIRSANFEMRRAKLRDELEVG